MNSKTRSRKSTRNYDPIMFEEIQSGNEAWILEDNPPNLNSEELEAFRTKLSDLTIQSNDGPDDDGNVSLSLVSHFCIYIPSHLN